MSATTLAADTAIVVSQQTTTVFSLSFKEEEKKRVHAVQNMWMLARLHRTWKVS